MNEKMKTWHEHLMKTWEELKLKDPTIKLKDAMKVAKGSYVKQES